MSNSIPLWGLLTFAGAAFYFIWQMKMDLILNSKRMDQIEKSFDKIQSKLDLIEEDLKELNKKVK